MMKNISEEQGEYKEDLTEVGDDLLALIEVFDEPLLVLDLERNPLLYNQAFHNIFEISDENGEAEIRARFNDFRNSQYEVLFKKLTAGEGIVRDFPISGNLGGGPSSDLILSAKLVQRRLEGSLYFLFFKAPEAVVQGPYIQASRNFQNILAHAPALICLLKGPDHIFELANDKYLHLIGKSDIKGKTVREVMPELEGQGFLEILDSVFVTGTSYLGEEVSILLKTDEGKPKRAFLDFLYQPTRDSAGKVDGIFVHGIDVTEKVEARQKVQETKDQLLQLIDTMPAIVRLSDKDKNTTYLNKGWYKYTGQTRKLASKTGWLSSIHPDDQDFVKERYRKAHEEQREFTISFRLLNRKGKYRWITDSAKPRYNSDGEFEGMIGILVDVHEEKLKEELIREREHRIRSIVEEANVATALYLGEDMKIDLANEAMLDVWGKDRSVIGKNLKEALPELEGQPFHELLREVYRTGETYWGKEDKVDLNKDGKLRSGYFNFTYKALKNEEGKIFGILNMALDVTEMVESKVLLKENVSHFRQMANLMPEKVANTDPQGNLIFLNQNWVDFTGLSNEELLEKGWTHLIHPEEKDNYERNWQRSLKTGTDFEMELRFLDRNGNYKWHLSRAEAVKDDQENIRMWIGNNTEIQKLKEEEKRKEDFLKMVSHELKTPVTSIKGYVQLLSSLLHKETGQAQSNIFKSSLLRIDHQINRLTRLIGEILDISRIEESKLSLQKSYFSMNELVNETVQDIQLTNTQHHISISHSFLGTVFADRDRIGQVLINVIINAIKYSPESKEVQVHIWSPEEDIISVTVKDKGIGIAEKNQKDIFKRFYRAGGKSQETYSGFGIGLYLANEIIERHNGRLRVKSELGRGSEFTFSLALTKTNTTEE